MRKTALVILSLLVGCAAGESGEVEFSTLAHGEYALGITGRISEAFTDPVSFETFWKEIYRGTDPIPKVPKVDFAEEMVIAVSPGEMRTEGYDTEIVRVIDKDTRIEVTILVSTPSGGSEAESITQPHHIIKLPKKNLPIVYKWVQE